MTDPFPAPNAASPIQAFLEQLLERYAPLSAGRVADYIPELAKADPAAFGIVIATVDGQVYEVGQSRQTFTIQSVSKPLVYGAVLEDCGRERVLRSVGVEPTGEAFNSISLEPGTGRPLNPMINAGAIAVSSLVQGPTREARLARIVDALSSYAGRPLALDEAVFESERSTGHRNRAIGHMLRTYGIVGEDPEPALELYFRQCSVLVDCRDLALMAATLANGGVHPVTGQRALRAEFISSVLSVMATCGIYDTSCSRRAPRRPACAPATRSPTCARSGAGRRPRMPCSTRTVHARWSSSCRATCASPTTSPTWPGTSSTADSPPATRSCAAATPPMRCSC